MRNNHIIKITLIISVLIHVILALLVDSRFPVTKRDARKIIPVEYYYAAPEKKPAKRSRAVTRAKKPVRQKTAPPPARKQEAKPKPPTKPADVIAKPKEPAVRAKKPRPVKAAPKAPASDDDRKSIDEIKLPLRHESREAQGDVEPIHTPKKSVESEKEPVGGSGSPVLKVAPVKKGDVRIARILPSLDRLEELERFGGDSELGLDEKEVESIYLDSTNLKFTSYLDHLKLAIELAWNYPEDAARRGIQGEGVLRFTVAKDGGLEDVKLLSTTGSKILDERFVRAIKMAAPFPPLPKSFRTKNLNIVATYRYVLSIVYRR